MSVCPSPEWLGRLGHDSLSLADFAAIEEHLAVCSRCQQALEDLAAWGSVSNGSVADPVALTDRPPVIPGFVFECELGRGGMGIVYRAWQTQLGRHVAIKVLRASDTNGAEERKRWLREAQAMVRVRHPNVVQLHEVGEQNGCLYLVLEYIASGSLANRAQGPLPARVAAELMVKVARAVEQIHRAGILHLDIKPSNILLDGPVDAAWDQITPMITDFGIARAGDDPNQTVSGSIGIRGTPSYMAPEQIGGSRGAIGPTSDVFALGSTLYRLLTGRPPFQAWSVIETLDQLRTGDPASPTSLIPGLPRDLETIVMKCLRKDPKRRYDSAEALADDLRRWLYGDPIKAHPITRLERAGRWCRRRPAIAALLAVLALAMASSLVGFLTLLRATETQRVRAEAALVRVIAHEKAASNAVDDLVGLLATTVDSSHKPAEDRVTSSEVLIRDLMARMRQNRHLGESSLVSICHLVQQFAANSLRLNRFAEARGILGDALDLFESRRGQDPQNLRYEAESLEILLYLGVVVTEEGKQDEALALFERLEKSLGRIADDSRRFIIIFKIDASRRQIAGLMADRGFFEAHDRILDANISMLDHWGNSQGGDPSIQILAKLARAERVEDSAAIARIFRSVIDKDPLNQPISWYLEERVASWLANDIDLASVGDSSSSDERNENFDPDTRSDEIIRTLDLRSESIKAHPASLAFVARLLAAKAATLGMKAREAGRLEEARRIAERLLAVAIRLERRNPGEAEFHVMLSTAHEQMAKNSWKVEDYRAIEISLTKALAEASLALRLDPQNSIAGIKVAGLQDKLINLLVKKRPVPSKP